jgi:hypothetical protein
MVGSRLGEGLGEGRGLPIVLLVRVLAKGLPRTVLILYRFGIKLWIEVIV